MHSIKILSTLAAFLTLSACAGVDWSEPKAPAPGTREWYFRNADTIYKQANDALWDCHNQKRPDCTKEIRAVEDAEKLKEAARIHRVNELGGTAVKLGH